MRRARYLLLSMAVLCGGGAAQAVKAQVVKAQEEKGATTKPMDAAAELEALLAEHAASKENYPVKFSKYKPRFEAFAERHRGSDAGLEAELWLFSGCWWSRKDGTMNEKAVVIADRILEHYADSKKLGEMLDKAYVLSKAQKEDYCKRIEKLSKHPEPKAAVHLTLGKLYRRSKDASERRAGTEHFTLLVKKFKDIPYRMTTYGVMADAYLNSHAPESLVVGQVAPEIVGTGVDGKPMKLSDYRGKIVVLDFWGDW
jgi:hypothetical protein